MQHSFIQVFSTFAYYQSLHATNFRGASKGFWFILSLSASVAMICGLVFLVYYGWNVRWYLPILLFVLGLVVKAVWFAVEASLKNRDLPFLLSLVGFVAWPIAAVFMFRSVPTGI